MPLSWEYGNAFQKITGPHLSDPALFTFGAYGSERLHRNDLLELVLSRLEAKWDKPVDREHVLVIGGTSRNVDCARHAGVKVLAAATGHTTTAQLAEHQPDYVLEDLTDTDTVMRILQTF